MLSSVPYIEVPIGAVCCYIFLVFAFFNTHTSKVLKYFRLVLASCIIWCAGETFMRLQIKPGAAFWYNVSLLGLLLAPVSVYGFLFCMLDIKKHLLLTVSGIAACAVVICNIIWNRIFPVPGIRLGRNGEVGYTYPATSGFYIIVFMEIILLVYIICLVYKRVRHERAALVKLIPFLIGILLILLGNCMDLIPGNTFPYSVLGGMGLAVCLAYIMFKQYLFDLRYRLVTGLVYTAAVVLMVLPVIGFSEKLKLFCIGAATYDEKRLVLDILILCIWSACVMTVANRQVNKIVYGKERGMLERVQRFQEETVSLLNRKELFDKVREVLHDLYRDMEVCIYANDEKSAQFKPVDTEDRNFLAEEQEESIITGIRQSNIPKNHGEIALLKYDNVTVGFIYLKGSFREPLNYMEIECFHQISSHASICLKNIHIFEEVYQISVHDELTGLYNRSYWQKYREESLSSWDNHSFIYMDVDDFKLFNEIYGGACGDQILSWCGRVITETVEAANAVAFRIGSNEFIIDTHSNDCAEVMKLAHGVQKNLLREDAAKPNVLQPITMSVGIATYPGTASRLEDLFRQAELAAFFAKKNGKNRVTIYAQDIENSGEEEKRVEAYEQAAPTIYALMAAIDAKDSCTFEHSTHVSDYAVLLAKELGLQNHEIEIVKEAGLLHDIGKIGVPESILMKQGKLTQEEYELMKKHVANSIEMIHFLPNMNYVIPAVLSHHERYDGKGYPRGIAGEDIPYLGRILAVCDSYDAMISRRSYKDAMTEEYAVEELEKNRGTQFDPELAEAFVRLIKEGKITAILNT